MNVRPAIETDAACIVKLIQQSFHSHMVNAMIYGCHGIGLYVRQCISAPMNIIDTLYVVAEDNHRMVGCLELRLIGKVLFLNYICTSVNMRHKGVGREMLHQAIQMIRPSSYNQMSLDVFYNNWIAKLWYEKLGFQKEYKTNWWCIPLTPGRHIDSGKISGLAPANVCQRELGFSQFILTTASGSYSVGRIGSDWFRISQESMLDDDQALTALSGLDPKRRILGLFHENAIINFSEESSPFNCSERMTVELALLQQTLID